MNDYEDMFSFETIEHYVFESCTTRACTATIRAIVDQLDEYVREFRPDITTEVSASDLV